MQNIIRPRGQLLMINLGLISATFMLVFFPINIILTLTSGSDYHNYNDYGLIGNIIHFTYPLLSLFELKILGQIRNGQFSRSLENLKIWFWVCLLIIFVPLVESYLLNLNIDYNILYDLLLVLFIFYYWNQPSHREFFNKLK